MARLYFILQNDPLAYAREPWRMLAVWEGGLAFFGGLFGAFSAFLVALFAEMYGFPLTIYLLSRWLSSHFPDINFPTHDAGHLLVMLFGWQATPHLGPFCVSSLSAADSCCFRRRGRYYTSLNGRIEWRRPDPTHAFVTPNMPLSY